MTHSHSFSPTGVRRLLAAAACLLLATAAPVAAQAQTSDTSSDARSFPDTGYSVSDDAIWGYFLQNGGVPTFGEPISREVTLLGLPTQFFQRGVLQVAPDGTVAPMNLMDPTMLGGTRFNGSTIPAPDRALELVTPNPSQPDYGARLVDFVMAVVPDVWQNQPVNFQTTLLNTVDCSIAFPDGACQTSLLPLMSEEVWGAPTSSPAADPNNPNFVYQRFQRGVLMYNAADGTTQWMLMGDMLKSVMTGVNLPSDVAANEQASPFYRQYAPNQGGSLARAAQLPDTDLTGAFTPDAAPGS